LRSWRRGRRRNKQKITPRIKLQAKQ
jgi:hypothetical protein